jgi:hypothetical protein
LAVFSGASSLHPVEHLERIAKGARELRLETRCLEDFFQPALDQREPLAPNLLDISV